MRAKVGVVVSSCSRKPVTVWPGWNLIVIMTRAARGGRSKSREISLAAFIKARSPARSSAIP